VQLHVQQLKLKRVRRPAQVQVLSVGGLIGACVKGAIGARVVGLTIQSISRISITIYTCHGIFSLGINFASTKLIMEENI
jgi:hypothetical protein